MTASVSLQTSTVQSTTIPQQTRPEAIKAPSPSASKGKAKCCFCEKADNAVAMVSGYSKKLKPRVSCVPCHNAYRELTAHFGTWSPSQHIIPAIDVDRLTQSAQQNLLHEAATIRAGKDELAQDGRLLTHSWRVTSQGAGWRARQRLKENLSKCACTHDAKRHTEDREGNLLKCKDCDCDHFWYNVPQTRNTDLIVLQAVQVSAEASVLDKLRAVTADNGATKDEQIAAQQAMIRLMQKEAA